MSSGEGGGGDGGGVGSGGSPNNHHHASSPQPRQYSTSHTMTGQQKRVDHRLSKEFLVEGRNSRSTSFGSNGTGSNDLSENGMSSGTFQRRYNPDSVHSMTSTMSRARSIASLHLQAQRRVPSHLVLSPFPQNQPQALVEGRGGMQYGGGGSNGGGSNGGGGGGLKVTQHDTNPLSLSPMGISPPTERHLRNNTAEEEEEYGGMFRTERNNNQKEDGDGRNSDGLRVAHLHSQLTAAASRDRSSSMLRNVARMGAMFNTMEYASTDDDDDEWEGNGGEEGDDMRNAVMF